MLWAVRGPCIPSRLPNLTLPLLACACAISQPLRKRVARKDLKVNCSCGATCHIPTLAGPCINARELFGRVQFAGGDGMMRAEEDAY